MGKVIKGRFYLNTDTIEDELDRHDEAVKIMKVAIERLDWREFAAAQGIQL